MGKVHDATPSRGDPRRDFADTADGLRVSSGAIRTGSVFFHDGAEGSLVTRRAGTGEGNLYSVLVLVGLLGLRVLIARVYIGYAHFLPSYDTMSH